MANFDRSRRQVSIGLVTALGASLAGCLGGGDGGGSDPAGTGDDHGESDDGGNGDGDADADANEESTDDEPPERPPTPELTLAFETEDGEPVSGGMDVAIEHATESVSWSRSFDGTVTERTMISEGVTTFPVQLPGEYRVSIEPNEEGDFEPQEGEIEFTEEEIETGAAKELSLVLEGATPDSERFDFVRLDEGEYRIEPGHLEDRAIGVEVADDSDDEDDGAAVVIDEWAEADHQRWTVEVVDEEWRLHRLEAAHSGQVLQVDGASNDAGAAVTVGEDAGEEALHQRWTFVEREDGRLSIENAKSGLAIGVEDGRTDPGAAVRQSPFDGDDEQQFSVTEL